MLRYPAVVKAESENEDLVLNIDLSSTLLDFAGVTPPDDVQGVSLRPLLEDNTPDDWREDIYYRYYQQMDSYHRVARHEGVRGERYKLIHFTEPGFEGYELYDLDEDPTEMDNRIDDPMLEGVKTVLMERIKEQRIALKVD